MWGVDDGWALAEITPERYILITRRKQLEKFQAVTVKQIKLFLGILFMEHFLKNPLFDLNLFKLQHVI